ncbi:Plasma kallikrein [Armadillidium nasatum]|uniref:Plasma kallikrein n=1 Tax=Armadillidium nasatum TaxID=96803 RepID=A0A5N5TB63_9CRUS|nr:Plasma kallikrein [Armadillidium nasatum]
MYYACPPTSVCVPPKNCKPENITFDATSHNINGQEFKYVCGILSECEDHVCCNDPIEMSFNFEPNKTHWCYLKESFVESLKMDVLVYPYPGLEEPQTKENLYHVPALCPPGSICVPGAICSLEHISFSFGFSGNEFSCGNHTGSIGNICCTISGMFEPIQKAPEIKPHFMKTKNDAVTRRDSQWSFMESEYFPDNDVEVNKENLYKGASGRSAKTQEWVCGRTLSIANELNRIYAPFGDREAKEGDYPWHVAILSSSSYKYLCSGAIIDEKTVVTIAHCFDKHHSAGEILVRVGDLNLQLDTEKNPAFDVKVKHLIIHPNYNKINLDADIAILEMEESVKSLPHVKPVCLPHKNYSPVINQCKVPGWGQFSKSKEEKNEFNYGLRAARFYIIDNTQCQNSLRKVKELGAFFKLQKRGDGGSGLVCRDKDVYVLKGLVSYGFGCGLDLPGVYTDVEKYLYFINNYKKFIPTSSDKKVSSEDFGSTYVEQKFYSSEKQKYISDVETEDKIPTYITLQNEKINPPAYITVQKEVDPPTYITVQKEKIDPPAYITVQNDYQSSSKTNYAEESPVKVSYNDNQFIPISNPYETLDEEPYTYIKPQEPEYVERPEFNPNLYQPEKKVNVYTQNFIEDVPKYEENYSPNFDYEFSNPRDDEYDANFISRSEYKPEKLEYDDDESLIENTYEVSHNREGYSDITDPRDYDSSHFFDRRPSSNDYDSTLSDFGYEDTLSYQPDYRPNEDSVYQPDYTRPEEDSIYKPDYRPNEDSVYQPDYTKTNENSIYQPDYTRPEEDSIYKPDYRPNKDSIYQPDYTRPEEDSIYKPDYRPNKDSIYQPDYIRPNEDSVYQPDYTRPDEDSIYQPDYKRPNEDTIHQPDYTGPNVDSLPYRPDKRPYADKLSYQPDNARSDYATSDELDYPKRNFNYRPVNDFEEYHASKEDYLSQNDRLFYEDFDNLGYGKGLRRPSMISPKNANVKTYSKKASGKASGSSNFEASVKKGKVTSPLAVLKNKFWVK